MNFPPLNEQFDFIKRNTVEIISEDDLARKIERSLLTRKPLLVKLGADPSRPDLHLGHAVVLRKLRDFQDLGHQAILIIGDFTAMIGDPSGKNKTRPQLTLDETRQNGASYFEQASKMLDTSKTVIRYNSEWLSAMSFADVIRLASKYTVARMLERDDFEKRYHSGEPISLHELLYPLAQAMDSVELKNDVELGGSDQKFNLLVARDIQREYGIAEPQICITLPLLEGTDGVQKMSKSLDNYIGFNHSPREMFQATLKTPDAQIEKYATLTSILNDEELAALKILMNENPRQASRTLAFKVVKFFHGEDLATKELEAAERISQGGIPDEVEEVFVDEGAIGLLDALVKAQTVSSKGEARRLVEQGGVSLNDEKLTDSKAVLSIDEAGIVLKIGKRKFFRFKRK